LGSSGIPWDEVEVAAKVAVLSVYQELKGGQDGDDELSLPQHGRERVPVYPL
jgi:hypothetical protein